MTHFAGTYLIPLFAIVPLEYGDYSGLDDMDTELIQSFIDANFPHGYVMDIRDADNPFFCSHPDIGGLAAEVVLGRAKRPSAERKPTSTTHNISRRSDGRKFRPTSFFHEHGKGRERKKQRNLCSILSESLC